MPTESERACSVDGCTALVRASGLCMRHYDALRRRGSVQAVIRQQLVGKTPAERFWLNLVKGPDCWEWTGCKYGAGYGKMQTGYAKAGLAHRFSYEMHFGKIPPGMSVMHKCDNPGCVNPAHLSVGTHAENMADMEAKGRDRKVGSKGTKNASAKISEETVRAIRSSKESQNAIARRYGISQASVSNILLGRSWKHIE